MDVRTKAGLISLALVASALLCACSSGGGTGADATPTPQATVAPGVTPTGVGIRSQAKVDVLDVNMTGSPPSAKVQIVAKGFLSDGCTKITDISQKRDNNTITVTLGTYRAPNLMCIQVATAYAQSVDLDVAGLKAGTYTVTVDGVSKQFTLSADNAP